MSVDNSPFDAAAPALTETEPESEIFFSTAPRLPSEAGSWTLLLVPVLICLALLLFIALFPRG